MIRSTCCWIFCGCAVLVYSAQGITLDWNSVDWTTATNFGGITSQEFEIDSNNAGNDIRVTVSDPNNDLSDNIDDGTTYTGGFGAGQEALRIAANGQGVNQAITVTIDFLYTGGVSDVNFTLFDIDFNDGQFRDIITDFTIDGSAAGSSVTLTDGTANNFQTGDFTGLGYSYIGPIGFGVGASNTGDDASGNLGISFGSTNLSQISFQYENFNEGGGAQAIALYDISYVVPEASAIWAVLCLACCALLFRSRARHRQPQ